MFTPASNTEQLKQALDGSAPPDEDERAPVVSNKKAIKAAVDSATEDLVMRKYLLDRRPKQRDQTDKKPAPSIRAPDRFKVSVVDQDESDDSDDDLLLDDPELRRLQSARAAQLKQEWANRSKGQRNGDHVVHEVSENDFLQVVCKSSFEWIICHFYHPEFQMCKEMDEKLRKVAEMHSETRFIRVNALNVSFFTKKLQIKILPTVFSFYKGKVVDRIVGLSEVMIRESVDLNILVKRLGLNGAIAVEGRRAERPKFIGNKVQTLLDDF